MRKAEREDARPGASRSASVVIRGTEGMAVQFAKCCNPIPGDPILGFIKKGQGLVVHTHDCPSARRSRADSEKWIEVDWDARQRGAYRRQSASP